MSHVIYFSQLYIIQWTAHKFQQWTQLTSCCFIIFGMIWCCWLLLPCSGSESWKYQIKLISNSQKLNKYTQSALSQKIKILDGMASMEHSPLIRQYFCHHFLKVILQGGSNLATSLQVEPPTSKRGKQANIREKNVTTQQSCHVIKTVLILDQQHMTSWDMLLYMAPSQKQSYTDTMGPLTCSLSTV